MFTKAPEDLVITSLKAVTGIFTIVLLLSFSSFLISNSVCPSRWFWNLETLCWYKKSIKTSFVLSFVCSSLCLLSVRFYLHYTFSVDEVTKVIFQHKGFQERYCMLATPYPSIWILHADIAISIFHQELQTRQISPFTRLHAWGQLVLSLSASQACGHNKLF